jgi:hypothetical protein
MLEEREREGEDFRSPAELSKTVLERNLFVKDGIQLEDMLCLAMFLSASIAWSTYFLLAITDLIQFSIMTLDTSTF